MHPLLLHPCTIDLLASFHAHKAALSPVEACSAHTLLIAVLAFGSEEADLKALSSSISHILWPPIEQSADQLVLIARIEAVASTVCSFEGDPAAWILNAASVPSALIALVSAAKPLGKQLNSPSKRSSTAAALLLVSPAALGKRQKKVSHFFQPQSSSQSQVALQQEQSPFDALFQPFFPAPHTTCAPIRRFEGANALILHCKRALHAPMHILQVNKDIYCAKLLQFHDNYRPAYFGAAKAANVALRRFPFAKYAALSYDVDSDEEWEEEELEGVEIIDSSECSSEGGEALGSLGALDEDDDFLVRDDEEAKICKRKVQILPPALVPGTREMGIFVVRWETPLMPADPWTIVASGVAAVEKPVFPEALVGLLAEIISLHSLVGTCSMKELYREFSEKSGTKVSKRLFGEKMREIALYVQNRWTLKEREAGGRIELGERREAAEAAESGDGTENARTTTQTISKSINLHHTNHN